MSSIDPNRNSPENQYRDIHSETSEIDFSFGTPESNRSWWSSFLSGRTQNTSPKPVAQVDSRDLRKDESTSPPNVEKILQDIKLTFGQETQVDPLLNRAAVLLGEQPPNVWKALHLLLQDEKAKDTFGRYLEAVTSKDLQKLQDLPKIAAELNTFAEKLIQKHADSQYWFVTSKSNWISDLKNGFSRFLESLQNLALFSFLGTRRVDNGRDVEQLRKELSGFFLEGASLQLQSVEKYDPEVVLGLFFVKYGSSLNDVESFSKLIEDKDFSRLFARFAKSLLDTPPPSREYVIKLKSELLALSARIEKKPPTTLGIALHNIVEKADLPLANKIESPKLRTEKDALLRRTQELLGEDFTIPKDVYEALSKLLDQKDFLQFYSEQLKEISRSAQAGDNLVKDIGNVGNYENERTTIVGLTGIFQLHFFGKQQDKDLLAKFYTLIENFKLKIIAVNSQYVSDVLDVGYRDPEEYKYEGKPSRIYKKKPPVTDQERVLSEAGYYYNMDNLWVKAQWTRPSEGDPQVYTLTSGVAQPGGDARELTFTVDLSALPQLSEVQLQKVFSYIYDVSENTKLNPEEFYQKHIEGLVGSLGSIEAADIVNREAQQFRLSDIYFFDLNHTLGHPEMGSVYGVSKKEEYEARVWFKELLNKGEIQLDKSDVQAFHRALEGFAFREAFLELKNRVLNKNRPEDPELYKVLIDKLDEQQRTVFSDVYDTLQLGESIFDVKPISQADVEEQKIKQFFLLFGGVEVEEEQVKNLLSALGENQVLKESFSVLLSTVGRRLEKNIPPPYKDSIFIRNKVHEVLNQLKVTNPEIEKILKEPLLKEIGEKNISSEVLEAYGINTKTIADFTDLKLSTQNKEVAKSLREIYTFIGLETKLPKEIENMLLQLLEKEEFREMFHELHEKLVDAKWEMKKRIHSENVYSPDQSQSEDFRGIILAKTLQIYETLDNLEGSTENRNSYFSQQFLEALLYSKGMNTAIQNVTDLIRLANYPDLELDKLKSKEKSGKPQWYQDLGGEAGRWFESYAFLEPQYNSFTPEEKSLFDEGYLLAHDNKQQATFWKKHIWEQPANPKLPVYKFHIGFAQPGGDILESTLVLDLSKLTDLKNEETRREIFRLVKSACDSPNASKFEEKLKSWESDTIAPHNLQILKAPLRRFYDQINKANAEMILAFGDPSVTLLHTTRRKDEFIVRNEFRTLLQIAKIEDSKETMDLFAKAYSHPKFRHSFAAFFEEVVTHLSPNKNTPYTSNSVVKKSYEEMQESLKSLGIEKQFAPVIKNMFDKYFKD